MKRTLAAPSTWSGAFAAVFAGLLFPPGQAMAQATWEQNFDTGRAHLLAGRYPETEESLKEALRQAEKFAATDDRLADTLNELGMCMQRQAKNREAEDYLQRSLAQSKGVNRAIVLNNLAVVELDQAMMAKADKLFAEATEVLEQAGKKKELAMTLDNIGTTLLLRGHGTKALPYYQGAEKLWEELAWNEVNAPIVKANLGTLYLAWGKTEKAENYDRQAIAL